MALRWNIALLANLLLHSGAARRTSESQALLSELEDDARSVNNGTDISSAGAPSSSWPKKLPWTALLPSSRQVLGEGSFGIVVKYTAQCEETSGRTTFAEVGVKEVKEDNNMPMYEKQAQCREAVAETKVQMLMAEKDRAVRIFALNPKSCQASNLTNTKMNIMMARARGDGTTSDWSRRYDKKVNVPIALMLDIAKQLMYGARELHDQGYLHRDIKPANLLVEGLDPFTTWEDCVPGACRFTLADYGLACQQSKGTTNTCDDDVCGTPQFWPPEIARSYQTGDRGKYYYGPGMDYWAIGVTLFEMWSALLPGKLGDLRNIDDIVKELSDMSTESRRGYTTDTPPDNDWWKSTSQAKHLFELAEDLPGAEGSSESRAQHRLFVDLLKILLMPDRDARENAVDAQFAAIFDEVPTPDLAAAVPQVCVDPCAKCPKPNECRASGLEWECVRPLHLPIKVTVTVLDAAGSNSHDFVLKPGAAGSTLKDLKVLVAQYYKVDTSQAVFFFKGVTGTEPLDDTETLQDNEELDMSIALRNALVWRWIGSLASAIRDAKKARNVEIPFIEVAEQIQAVWPHDLWPRANNALHSQSSQEKALLADKLQPLVTEAQLFIGKPLTSWQALLSLLKQSDEARRAEDSRLRLLETTAHCQAMGLQKCVKDVRMEMPETVDYVKVSYRVGSEARVKVKFYQNGEVLQTRGNGVMSSTNAGPARLQLPTLPGDTELTVSICKDLMQERDHSIMTRMRNAVTFSKSRCQQMAEPIKYSFEDISTAPGGHTNFTQADITQRKLYRFTISGHKTEISGDKIANLKENTVQVAKVSFLIWEGNWNMPRRKA